MDFDDAVEVERINDAYKVGVHIADVSFYVKENTEIDKEAYLRGTSIYVADRVVPMLPKELSNGICSLNPNVERLTLSIYLYIDKYGNVFKHEIHPAVIKSKARMTYKQVNSILEGKNEGYSEDIIDLIKLLYEVSQKIRKRRNNNGCLNLSTTEVKFRLDENANERKSKSLAIFFKPSSLNSNNQKFKDFGFITDGKLFKRFKESKLLFKLSIFLFLGSSWILNKVGTFAVTKALATSTFAAIIKSSISFSPFPWTSLITSCGSLFSSSLN